MRVAKKPIDRARAQHYTVIVTILRRDELFNAEYTQHVAAYSPEQALRSAGMRIVHRMTKEDREEMQSGNGFAVIDKA
jgi:hypothetical protein